MSSTILYPLLLLAVICHCMSEVPQEEKGLQNDTTEHLNVEDSGAGLTFAEFQQHVLTGIHSELAELRSTVRSLKNRLEVTEEHLRKKGNSSHLLFHLCPAYRWKISEKKKIIWMD